MSDEEVKSNRLPAAGSAVTAHELRPALAAVKILDGAVTLAFESRNVRDLELVVRAARHLEATLKPAVERILAARDERRGMFPI